MKQRLFYFLIGLFLGYWLARSEMARVAAPHPSSPPQRSTPPSAPAAKDDLTTIKGIGATFEQALNRLGIATFAQLARCDADELAGRLGRVSAERIRREGWIEQAQARADERK